MDIGISVLIILVAMNVNLERIGSSSRSCSLRSRNVAGPSSSRSTEARLDFEFSFLSVHLHRVPLQERCLHSGLSFDGVSLFLLCSLRRLGFFSNFWLSLDAVFWILLAFSSRFGLLQLHFGFGFSIVAIGRFSTSGCSFFAISTSSRSLGYLHSTAHSWCRSIPCRGCKVLDPSIPLGRN